MNKKFHKSLKMGKKREHSQFSQKMHLISLHSVNDVNFQNSVFIAALIHTNICSGALCLFVSNLCLTPGISI